MLISLFSHFRAHCASPFFLRFQKPVREVHGEERMSFLCFQTQSWFWARAPQHSWLAFNGLKLCWTKLLKKNQTFFKIRTMDDVGRKRMMFSLQIPQPTDRRSNKFSIARKSPTKLRVICSTFDKSLIIDEKSWVFLEKKLGSKTTYKYRPASNNVNKLNMFSSTN